MKHKNYEILNLIGYGLAKFDKEFVQIMGFKNKGQLYNYLVTQSVADTVGTIKNRQDLFDPFFSNGRRGWWQKGDAYLHRKKFIDSLFGNLDCPQYVLIVKAYLQENLNVQMEEVQKPSPILKSTFKQLQATGRQAELFFIDHFQDIEIFRGGELEDARLFGDGYDFQIAVQHKFFLAEVKGLANHSGAIRLTENEYEKAKEYQKDYSLVVVSNLVDIPRMQIICNPLTHLDFKKQITSYEQISYHTKSIEWDKMAHS